MQPMSNSLSRFLLSAIFLVAIVPLRAATPFSGTAEIEQSLHKLNQLGSVLMIGAHPDDERTGVLAYFARGRYMRTAYLSDTRGEGGQNLIGPEQGISLGIIRTQELLAARHLDGAEQFFTRAIDFGFTRTPDETLQKWGRERVLSDTVWVVRRFRPDVILLCWTGTSRDGHGQHQASAIIGKEAFEAAADPRRFPEQLQYVQPWRAKRLAVSIFTPPPQTGAAAGGRGGQAGRGGRGGTPAAAAQDPDQPPPPPLPQGPHVKEDTGAYNPVLGYSYEEIAGFSRSMHRSQGMGNLGRLGSVESEFIVTGGPAPSNDLFDGIDTSWNRLRGGAPVGTILAEALRQFDPAHPDKTIAPLLKAHALAAGIDDPLAKVKVAEMDEAIAECAGLWVDAQPKAPEIVPGATLNITVTLLNRSSVPLTLENARLEGMFDAELPAGRGKLEFNKAKTLQFERPIPASQPYTQPYWLVKPPTENVYTVEDQKLIGLADTPPLLRLRVRFSVDGAPFELLRPIQYRYAERTDGERVRPLIVIPPVAVNLPEPVAMFPRTAARTVSVALRANIDKAAGEVRLDLPAGWKVAPRSRPFQIAAANEQEEVTFEVAPPAGEATVDLRAIATLNGREIASGMQVISYPHIPVEALFPPAEGKLVRANIQVAARRVGYIMGAGDEMPDALRQLGIEVTLLSRSDLEQADLSQFDAIVAGVRAYDVRADVRANHPRLLNYVRNGGTYIVQYNRERTQNLGPYPFTIPNNNQYRVTEEDAPVTLPHIDSRLLQAPNHITPSDFQGWVQERGAYFASKWDPQYETVLESHDQGEKPLAGGELWARVGKGVYIFTAYSWFRQLPAGVPGAYRLFANLLSAK